MTRSLLRAVIVVRLSSLMMPIEAMAQTSDQTVASSLGVLKPQLPAGEIIYVTDRTGTTVKGTLIEISNDAIEMRVSVAVKRIRAADVSRIQWQKRDSLLNGVLIGAAVGAIPGVYWLIADPNECTGLCAEDYVAIGVGALVGGLIDRAIKKKATVYEAPSSKTTKVTVAPLLVRHRLGVQVALTF